MIPGYNLIIRIQDTKIQLDYQDTGYQDKARLSGYRIQLDYQDQERLSLNVKVT